MVDSTHTNALEQAEAVLETLANIDADHIPMLTVLNKADMLADTQDAEELLSEFEDGVLVSALTGEGIDNLLVAVHRKLFQSYIPISVHLPFKEGALIALFHEQGQVAEIVHTRKGVFIDGRLPGRLIARYRPFENQTENEWVEDVSD